MKENSAAAVIALGVAIDAAVTADADKTGAAIKAAINATIRKARQGWRENQYQP